MIKKEPSIAEELAYPSSMALKPLVFLLLGLVGGLIDFLLTDKRGE